MTYQVWMPSLEKEDLSETQEELFQLALDHNQKAPQSEAEYWELMNAQAAPWFSEDLDFLEREVEALGNGDQMWETLRNYDWGMALRSTRVLIPITKRGKPLGKVKRDQELWEYLKNSELHLHLNAMHELR